MTDTPVSLRCTEVLPNHRALLGRGHKAEEIGSSYWSARQAALPISFLCTSIDEPERTIVGELV